MRWGKPLKKERVRNPRYFLNEDFCDEHGVCEGCGVEHEEEIEEELESNPSQKHVGGNVELELRKALIAARQLGDKKAAKRYLLALRNLRNVRDNPSAE